MARGGTLYFENLRFDWVWGQYALNIQQVSAFNIVNSEFRTQFRVYADLGIRIYNSIGEIHGGYVGDFFDHAIDISRTLSEEERVTVVRIDDVRVEGSNINYADGIRIHGRASVSINNSEIVRLHSDAEPWGSHTDGVAAGIQFQSYENGSSSNLMEMRGNTISGYDVGISIDIGGFRVLGEDNEISGISYPMRTWSDGIRTRTDPVIDFGRGPLGSSGGNTFSSSGTYAVYHQDTDDIAACSNSWSRPAGRSVPDRIWDHVDDTALGFVNWDICGAEGTSSESGPSPTEEVLFPTSPPSTQPPTVNIDTLCWSGPGSQYEVVSSVQQGTEIEIIGLGAIENWLVIDNPLFPGVTCWLNQDDVDVDPNFDLSYLIVFPVPPPPTSTPLPLPTPTLTPAPINYQNPLNSYPRCKQRGITEFSPHGYGFWKNMEPS